MSSAGDVPVAPHGAAVQAARTRGAYRLMFDRVYGPFFWGNVLAASGVWFHNVVAAIVAFELTGSALIVGLISVFQFVPQLFFAMLAGKMADRGNPGVQIVIGRLLVGIGSGGLALWIWIAGGVTELQGPAPLLAASMVVGLGYVVGGPAMQSIIPSLIRPGEITAAMSLSGVPMIVARAAGPALGALMATQLGPATAFGIAAAANVAYAMIVMSLRLPRVGGTGSGTDLSIRTALRHLRSDSGLRALLIGIAAVGFGAEPSLTLAPSLAEKLAAADHLVGWLASAFGLGAGLGFFLFPLIHRWLGLARLSSWGLLLMAAGLVTAAATGQVGIAVTSFGMSGVGMTLAFTSITTQIQDRSPDALRGRIMALWLLGFLGVRPFAAALNGYLADALSVEGALVMTAALVTVVAYLCRPSRLSVGARTQQATAATAKVSGHSPATGL